ncbi:MAG: hypothetical protein ACKVQC_01175 [Elusimicrobiota bacterium]
MDTDPATMGRIVRSAAGVPKVYGGSWSDDGFQNVVRSDNFTINNTEAWVTSGQTVPYTTRNMSWSSNRQRSSFNAGVITGQNVVVLGANGNVIDFNVMDVWGEGSFNSPVARITGSWTKTDTSTYFDRSYNNFGRPTAIAPRSVSKALSYNGLALETVDDAYSASLTYTTSNDAIWAATAEQRTLMQVTFGYSSNANWGGSFDDPYASNMTGARNASWSVVNYKNSYVDNDPLRMGRLIRSEAGMPQVIGGSWSDDGFQTITRSDNTTFNNPLVWATMGQTTPLEVRSKSWSSDRSRVTWNAQAALGENIVVYNAAGNSLNFNVMNVWGDGTFEAPIAKITGSWNKSESTTYFDRSYNQYGRPTAQAPRTISKGLNFNGLALPHLDDGYSASYSYTSNNNLIWEKTGEQRTYQQVTFGYSSNENWGGNFDNPYTSTVTGARQTSWNVADYSHSYVTDNEAQIGRVIRSQAGTPKVFGGSWSDDGFQNVTHADTVTINNSIIWSTMGQAIPLESRALSWSSDRLRSTWDARLAVGNDVIIYDASGQAINMNVMNVWGRGTFENPIPRMTGSWNKSDATTYYELSYNQYGRPTAIAPRTLSKGLNYNGLSVPGLDDAYSGSFTYISNNDIIWQRTGEQRTFQQISFGYSSNANWDGDFDNPYTSTVTGARQTSWNVTDYSKSYVTANNNQIGQVIRTQAGVPKVYGGSWSDDGFQTITRADTFTTNSTLVWANMGQATPDQVRNMSWSSNRRRDTWDARAAVGSDVMARDKNGNIINFNVIDAWGEGSFDVPIPKSTGSWNKTDSFTYYDLSYNEFGRPTATAPRTVSDSLNYNGLSIPGLDDAYTASKTYISNNDFIWKITGEQRSLMQVSFSYSSNAAWQGSFDNPYTSTVTGAKQASWSVTDFSKSYITNDPEKVGQVNRTEAGVPKVYGGSWSDDGFQNVTRADTFTTNNTIVWMNVATTVPLEVRSLSWSSNRNRSTWDARQAVGQDVIAYDAQGNTLNFNVVNVFGEGSFDVPVPKTTGSWSKTDSSTYYDLSYNQFGRPTAVAPRFVSRSLGYNGLSLDTLDDGYTGSLTYGSNSDVIWSATGEQRSALQATFSYSSNAAWEGSFDNPYQSQTTGARSASWSVTDYTQSYVNNDPDHMGQIIRSEAGVPKTYGGSWNDDGFQNVVRAQTTTKNSTEIWSTVGQATPFETNVKSWSSNRSRGTWDALSEIGHDVIVYDALGQALNFNVMNVWGGGEFNNPIARNTGSWTKSDSTTYYDLSYNQFGRPTARAPRTIAKSLSYNGLAMPDLDDAYSASVTYTANNNPIWQLTGEQRALTQVTVGYSSNANWDGDFDNPYISSITGARSASWSIVDYSKSYVDSNASSMGQIIRTAEAAPTTYGGSWSDDGFQNVTRAETTTINNAAPWINAGLSIPLTSNSKSWTSNRNRGTWDAQAAVGHNVYAYDVYGNQIDFNVMSVWGEGTFDDPKKRVTGGWTKNDSTTYFEKSYNEFGRPMSDAPYSVSKSLTYNGLSLPNLDDGYFASVSYLTNNNQIWQGTGEQRSLLQVTYGYSSNAAWGGSFNDPYASQTTGARSTSWSIADYSKSFVNNDPATMGRVIRSEAGVPKVYGGSWSDDGFQNVTRADTFTKNNTEIWNTMGQAVNQEVRSLSWSSNRSRENWNASSVVGQPIIVYNEQGQQINMSNISVWGGGSFASPVPKTTGSWSKTDSTTYFDLSYDRFGRPTAISPRTISKSLSYNGLSIPIMDDAYTASLTYISNNDIIWAATGEQRTLMQVSFSYSSNAAWGGSFDNPYASALTGARSASWSVADYSRSYEMNNAESMGQIIRTVAGVPKNYGGSWSDDGLDNINRSDIFTTNNANAWINSGQVVPEETRVKSWTSNRNRGAWDAQSVVGSDVEVRDAQGQVLNFNQMTVWGEFSFDQPGYKKSGGWNKSDSTTYYKQSYNQYGRPTTRAPHTISKGLSYSGLPLETIDDAFSATLSYTTNSDVIWELTGEQRSDFQIVQGYSSNSNWGGSFDNPFASRQTGARSATWSVSDYSLSYEKSDPLKIGSLKAAQLPKVFSGSWSTDGKHSFNRTNNETTNNITVWGNTGALVPTEVVSRTFSSNAARVNWDIASLTGQNVFAFDPNGNQISFNNLNVWGGGEYSIPIAKPTGSWNSSESRTSFAGSYNSFGRPTALAPITITTGINFDGLAPAASGGGKSTSITIAKNNDVIWQATGEQRALNTKTTTNNETPGTGAYSESVSETDFSQSYEDSDPEKMGRVRRESTPTSKGTSFSFDGFLSYVGSESETKNNGVIWSNMAQVTPLEVLSRSWSSNLGKAGSFNSPIAQITGAWFKSESKTFYDLSYNQYGKNISAAPRTETRTLNYSGSLIDGYSASQSNLSMVDAIWEEYGEQRNKFQSTAGWSSDAGWNGSYNSPVVGELEVSTNWSQTDYAGSYSATGQLTGVLPQTQGGFWNYDLKLTYTAGTTETTHDDKLWNLTGNLYNGSVKTRSWSSDETSAGSLDSPLALKDGSLFRSQNTVNYAGSYSTVYGTFGRPTESAPTAEGWRWSDNGLGDGVMLVGISKAITKQSNRNDIWYNLGEIRTESSTDISWSSDRSLVSGQTGSSGSEYGAGSLSQPVIQEDGTSFRAFTKMTYENSFFASNGKANAAAAPLSEGWVLSHDGFRFTKTINKQTHNGTVFGNTSRVVALLNDNKSFSSDDRMISSDVSNPDWGGGTYWTPVLSKENRTFRRSSSVTNYAASYDGLGRNTTIAPIVANSISESGELWRKREFNSQTEMDGMVSNIKSSIDVLVDQFLASEENQLKANLLHETQHQILLDEVGTIKANLKSAIDNWALSHTAANTSYDDFYDFIVDWLSQFPSLEEWKNVSNFDIQHELYNVIQKDSEHGPNTKFIGSLTGLNSGNTTVDNNIAAALSSGGDFKSIVAGVTSATTEVSSNETFLKDLGEKIYHFSDKKNVKFDHTWRSMSLSKVKQENLGSVWKNLGKQVVSKMESKSTSISLDEVETSTVEETDYVYDTETGDVISASGSGTTITIDVYGNKQTQTFTKDYAQVALNQALLTEQITTSMTSNNADGSSVIMNGENSTQFSYNKYAQLTDQTSQSSVTNNDGFGNLSHSDSSTTFIIIQGIARADKTTSHSTSYSNDGSVTVADDSVLDYDYDNFGNLTKVTMTDGSTKTTDIYGNTQERKAVTNYRLFMGQARVYLISATTESNNTDGSKSTTQTETLNRWQSSGAMAKNIASTTRGTIISDDGYGNLTVGLRSEGKGIFQETKNYKGFAKQRVNVTKAKTSLFDGSWNESTSWSVSQYSANGVLLGGNGWRDGKGDDGNGNTEITYGTDQLEVIRGVLKIKTSNVRSLNSGLDGSFNHTVLDINYTNAQTGVVKLLDAQASGRRKSNDGWGNLTRGIILQKFDKVVIANAGRALAEEVTTRSTTYAMTGAVTESEQITFTRRDGTGKSLSQFSLANSRTDDSFGNLSFESNRQEFEFRQGLFKVTSVISEGGFSKRDLSEGLLTTITTYKYSSNFKLIGANGTTLSIGWDRWNNRNRSFTINTYGIFAGQAKIIRSDTRTQLSNIDGSWQDRGQTQLFGYTDNGRIYDSYSYYSFVGGDGFLTNTFGNGFSNYDIWFGQAYQTTGFNQQGSDSLRGGWSESQENVVYNYTYGLGQGNNPYLNLNSFNDVTPFAMPKFLTVSSQGIYNSQSFDNGILSIETNGVRNSYIIGNTNILKVTDETVLNYRTYNQTGWYPIDQTAGSKVATYTYDNGTAEFVSGYSLAQTNVFRSEKTSGVVNYFGTNKKETFFANMAGKRVVLLDVTTSKLTTTYNGVVKSVSNSSAITDFYYNAVGNSTYSIEDSNSTSTSEGVFSRSHSIKTSLNLFGVLDSISTVTTSTSIGKLQEYVTTSRSWVNRTWSIFGQTGATGGFSNSTTRVVFNNATGAMGGHIQGSTTSGSSGTNKYAIYYGVGEQVMVTRSSDGNSQTVTTYKRNAVGLGLSSVSVNTRISGGGDWVSVAVTSSVRDWGEHFRINTVALTEVQPLWVFEMVKPVAVNLSLVRNYSYNGAGVLVGVDVTDVKARVAFNNSSYLNVHDLAKAIQGPLAAQNGILYFNTLVLDEKGIEVDYREDWIVVDGDAYRTKTSHDFGFMGFKNNGINFTGDYIRVHTSKQFTYFNNAFRQLTHVENTNYKEHLSTNQNSFQIDPRFVETGEIYSYSHANRFGMKIENGAETKAGDIIDEEINEEIVKITRGVAPPGGVPPMIIDWKSLWTTGGVWTQRAPGSRLKSSLVSNVGASGFMFHWGNLGNFGFPIKGNIKNHKFTIGYGNQFGAGAFWDPTWLRPGGFLSSRSAAWQPIAVATVPGDGLDPTDDDFRHNGPGALNRIDPDKGEGDKAAEAPKGNQKPAEEKDKAKDKDGNQEKKGPGVGTEEKKDAQGRPIPGDKNPGNNNGAGAGRDGANEKPKDNRTADQIRQDTKKVGDATAKQKDLFKDEKGNIPQNVRPIYDPKSGKLIGYQAEYEKGKTRIFANQLVAGRVVPVRLNEAQSAFIEQGLSGVKNGKGEFVNNERFISIESFARALSPAQLKSLVVLSGTAEGKAVGESIGNGRTHKTFEVDGRGRSPGAGLGKVNNRTTKSVKTELVPSAQGAAGNGANAQQQAKNGNGAPRQPGEKKNEKPKSLQQATRDAIRELTKKINNLKEGEQLLDKAGNPQFFQVTFIRYDKKTGQYLKETIVVSVHRLADGRHVIKGANAEEQKKLDTVDRVAVGNSTTKPDPKQGLILYSNQIASILVSGVVLYQEKVEKKAPANPNNQADKPNQGKKSEPQQAQGLNGQGQLNTPAQKLSEPFKAVLMEKGPTGKVKKKEVELVMAIMNDGTVTLKDKKTGEIVKSGTNILLVGGVNGQIQINKKGELVVPSALQAIVGAKLTSMLQAKYNGDKSKFVGLQKTSAGAVFKVFHVKLDVDRGLTLKTVENGKTGDVSLEKGEVSLFTPAGVTTLRVDSNTEKGTAFKLASPKTASSAFVIGALINSLETGPDAKSSDMKALVVTSDGKLSVATIKIEGGKVSIKEDRGQTMGQVTVYTRTARIDANMVQGKVSEVQKIRGGAGLAGASQNINQFFAKIELSKAVSVLKDLQGKLNALPAGALPANVLALKGAINNLISGNKVIDRPTLLHFVNLVFGSSVDAAANLQDRIGSFNAFLSSGLDVKPLFDLLKSGPDTSKFDRVEVIAPNNPLIIYEMPQNLMLSTNLPGLFAALGDANLSVQQLPGQYVAKFGAAMAQNFKEGFSKVKNDPRLQNGYMAIINQGGVPQIAVIAMDPANPKQSTIWTPLNGFTKSIVYEEPSKANLSKLPMPGINNDFRPGVINSGKFDLQKSFAPVVKSIWNETQLFSAAGHAFGNDLHHSQVSLSAQQLVGGLNGSGITDHHETAGVILVSENKGKLQFNGTHVFRTVHFRSETSIYPTTAQFEVAQTINDIWNQNDDEENVRAEIQRLLEARPEMQDMFVLSASFKDDEEKLLNVLLGAEAFSTEAGIMVLDKSYRHIQGTFVPFHTHLGHPENFTQWAPYSPTPEDISAHKSLMVSYRKTHGIHLNLPGVIFHSAGQISMFWVSQDGSGKVQLQVFDGEGKIFDVITSEKTLAYAYLGVDPASDHDRPLEQKRSGLENIYIHKVILWDNRRRLF